MQNNSNDNKPSGAALTNNETRAVITATDCTIQTTTLLDVGGAAAATAAKATARTAAAFNILVRWYCQQFHMGRESSNIHIHAIRIGSIACVRVLMLVSITNFALIRSRLSVFINSHRFDCLISECPWWCVHNQYAQLQCQCILFYVKIVIYCFLSI